MHKTVDGHAKPPEHLRTMYKTYQKSRLRDIDTDDQVFDAHQGHMAGFVPSDSACRVLSFPDDTSQVIARFLENTSSASDEADDRLHYDTKRVFEHPHVPGRRLRASRLAIIVAFVSEGR